MKYLFVFSEKFYSLIELEWNLLKQLRRKRRKNIFLRGFFALFSLLSILSIYFFPPFIFGILFGEGIRFSIFFLWIWILNLTTALILIILSKIFNYDYDAILYLSFILLFAVCIHIGQGLLGIWSPIVATTQKIVVYLNVSWYLLISKKIIDNEFVGELKN